MTCKSKLIEEVRPAVFVYIFHSTSDLSHARYIMPNEQGVSCWFCLFVVGVCLFGVVGGFFGGGGMYVAENLRWGFLALLMRDVSNLA